MNVRSWFTKRRIIWLVIGLALVGGALRLFVFRPDDTSAILTDTVKRQNLKQTVLATGQVSSETDLSLNFRTSGVVQRVGVKVGDTVRAGSVLANLDGRDQQASLTSARGALAQAQANYQKVLAGASSEEVVVAQAAVDAAQVTLDNANKTLDETKQQQQTLVNNAQAALYNSGLAATPATSNLSSGTVTISGTYTGSVSGAYTIRISGGGARFDVLGLGSGSFDISRTAAVPLGAHGLFVQFSATGQFIEGDTWTVEIPNTRASTYITTLNAYNAALETQRVTVSAAENSVAAAQAALDQAVASLNLKRAAARPADLEAARAQILSAQGQVAAASAALENSIIRAPVGGTITAVNIKVGEQAGGAGAAAGASAGAEAAIVLQDVDNLHIEANVSEANIAAVVVGQTMDITFDALGPDRHFQAAVAAVDPASTVVSGVVNYKVTATLDKAEAGDGGAAAGEVKPGMTANMSILVAERQSALAVPARAVLTANNGGGNGASAARKTVRVIDDPKKKTYHEVEVQTGLEADGGLVEVLAGLEEGQEIVTLIDR